MEDIKITKEEELQQTIDSLAYQLYEKQELLDKIYQYMEVFIIDDELDHDCCEEEKHYIALELLGFYPKKDTPVFNQDLLNEAITAVIGDEGE